MPNGAASGEKGGRAADDLFAHFARAIRSGDLKAGEPLPPEREIVEAHGVSRTVVREALRQLASLGLIDARPRFRPVVRKASFDAALETIEDSIIGLLATPQDIRYMYETRILVEEALVRHAAKHATEADLAKLHEVLEENGRAIGDDARFFETDIAFHTVLYDIMANPILLSIHRGFETWLAPQWTAMKRGELRNRRNHIAHRSIYEAIVTRDPDQSARALRNHLEDAWRVILKTFD